MKVLKSLFLVLTLTIIGYSAAEAGAHDLITEEIAAGRSCCTYQADCPADHTCTTISPSCSQNRIHICKKNAVAVEEEGAAEDEPAIP